MPATCKINLNPLYPQFFMTDTVRLTIDWRTSISDMPEAQQEAFTQSLFQDLRRADAVETVERVPDPDVPDGGMGAQWLWSILTAEIPGNGIKLALQEVFARLPGKPIDFVVELEGGRKMEVKGIRPNDIDAVAEKVAAAAQKLKDVE
ncbi:MAG: hypothetical protein AAFV90_18705 [Cyanobacteria bacterium J06634_5]